MSLPAMSLGSVRVERVGQGEMGGCTQRVQIAWLCLGLGEICSCWSSVGHLSPPLHKWAGETVLLPCRAAISGSEASSQTGRVVVCRKLWPLKAC